MDKSKEGTLNLILSKYLNDNSLNLKETKVTNSTDYSYLRSSVVSYDYGYPMSVVLFTNVSRILGTDIYIRVEKNGELLYDDICPENSYNYFKVIIKEIIVNNLILIKDYKHNFLNECEESALMRDLNNDCFMSFSSFRRLCRVLEMEFEISLVQKSMEGLAYA